LSWVGDDPVRQDLAGVKLPVPTELHVKKQTLASTFQIQTDSLLLTLKRNNFSPVRSDAEWTVFSVPAGFSPPPTAPRLRPSTLPRARLELPDALPAFETGFASQLTEKWSLIVDGRDVTRLPIATFLDRAIDVFGISGMARAEMFHVLSLVTFTTVPGFVGLSDFAMLFANFGEKNSIFPKLIATLNSRLVTDRLLVFKCVERALDDGVYFSVGASFGWLIAAGERRTLVRNDFDIPFFSEWLVGEDGAHFQTWDDALARCAR
jgi:hypothetical protein